MYEVELRLPDLRTHPTVASLAHVVADARAAAENARPTSTEERA
jgi:hypothetical protein